MIEKKKRIMFLSLLFLLAAICFIFIDAKNTEKSKLMLMHISENGKSVTQKSIFSGNAVVPSNSSKGSRARVLNMADTVGRGEATIKSSYFQRNNGASGSVITPTLVTNSKSGSFSVLKSASDKSGILSSSSSSSSGLYASLASGMRNTVSSGSFAQTRLSTTTSDSETPSGPMRVGGDDDPGEPPVPVGDGLWVLLLGAISYFGYKKKIR